MFVGTDTFLSDYTHSPTNTKLFVNVYTNLLLQPLQVKTL